MTISKEWLEKRRIYCENIIKTSEDFIKIAQAKGALAIIELIIEENE